MSDQRIKKHPILDIPKRKKIEFLWNSEELTGYEEEVISSALFANGIQIFGRHPKDNSPQGMFCANGQCSQCLVLAEGRPVKSCMTLLKPGMVIESIEGLPKLPEDDKVPPLKEAPVRESEVLIIGGGPAGLSAAIELGKLGVDTLLIDDKSKLGGKLLLQTHKFFGSVDDSHAGTRGFEIARILEDELRKWDSLDYWLNSTAVGVFSDGLVGVVKGNFYRKIRPAKILVATGATAPSLTGRVPQSPPSISPAGSSRGEDVGDRFPPTPWRAS